MPVIQLMQPTAERRLAAVLIADVAGYSRLMELDEAGTHERLRQIRRDVTDPAVVKHGGRIVRTVGDGLLAEFSSASAALQAGIEIQREMTERNKDVPPIKRIEHRIGVNLGDILVESHDIAGTGVNVAARLEALAPPGGIAISGTVYDQVRHAPGVIFYDAGSQRVKNISRPVRVYTVQFDGEASQWRRFQTSPWLRRCALAIAAMTFAGIGLLAVSLYRRPVPSMTFAVVPFTAKVEYLGVAHALTKEVTEATMRLRGLKSIAAAAIEGLAEKSPDLSRLQALGASHVLSGRLEDSASGLRLVTQLIDTASGASLWSDGFEVAPTAGPVWPSTVGPLMAALRHELQKVELAQLKTTDSPRARSLRAYVELINAKGIDDVRAARAEFERALAEDPQSVVALTGLADALTFEARKTVSESERNALLVRADTASLQAVTLDHNNIDAWGTRAQTLLAQHQLDAAAQAIEQALREEPYDADLYSIDAQIALARADPESAIRSLDRAIAINPRSNAKGVLLHYRCRTFLALKQFKEAIESCQRGLAFIPDWPDFMLLAAAYAQIGNMHDARSAKTELLRLNPQFTLNWYASLSHEMPGAEAERVLFDGLRKAGVPQ